MKLGVLRTLAVLILGPLAGLAAQADDFSVYLDTDRDPSTGCAVPVLGGQPLSGIDWEINVTVNRPPPVVASASQSPCQDPATGAFGPATPLPANIPVGIDVGVDGSDVVEVDALLADLGLAPGARVDLYLVASDGRSASAQAARSGYLIPSAGAPTPVPALPLLGLLALAAGLGFLTWRERQARMWIVGLVVLLLPGVAWLAVPHVSDGKIGDWAGASPAATSPAGDTATPETDVRRLYLAEQNQRLFFRVDVTELEAATAPVALITVDNPHPKVGARVTLHGASSDPVAGGSLKFAWSLSAAPAGSAVGIANPGSADQSFVPDVPGAYEFKLQVTNAGGSTSAPATAVVTATALTANAVPHAVVTAPQSVKVGSRVALSGAGSTDADLDPLSYAWTLVSKPAGSAASLTALAKAKTDFTPDMPGTYLVQLTVNDGSAASAPAQAQIVAVTGGVPPQVDAGAESHVLVGQQFELTPTITDADGDLASVTWRVVTRPDPASTAEVQRIPRGTKAELHYVFTPDAVGAFVLEVVAQDAAGNVASDRVRVLADAQPHPIANAGTDQTVKVGDTVTLDGRNSYDANGHAALTYQWSLTSGPAGTTVDASTFSGATPTFTADLAGDYVFQLVVSEGGVDSAPDSVTVTAQPVAAPASLYDKLLGLGLDSTDAHLLEANHKAEAEAVVAATDRMFAGFSLADSMFLAAADPVAQEFLSVCPAANLANWTPEQKARFRKIFGRLVFAVNTSLFRKAFNDQASLLDPKYQDVPPNWRPYPATYDEFRTAVGQALTGGGNALKLVMCSTATGVAHGVPPLKLKVEQAMMGDTQVGGQVKAGWPVNGAAGLVFHELTHSFGYAHNDPGDEVNNKPNNLPYFVQIILGYQAENILAEYCKGDPTCANPFYLQGSPNSLLTKYFGADTP